MRLYRIMLVDDEEEVRTGIIKQIDWEAAGFEIVGDAENGEDALEKLELLEPDLVLTDIRMPYMDGLTMSERIRQMHPSVKIVIFSGYDDFEYAKQAIKLNVIEYILKPVNVEELTAILVRIKKVLDDEIEQRRNVRTLRESFMKNLPILKDHFLQSLIHGQVDARKIPLLLREYHINLGDAKEWVVAQAVINSPQTPTDTPSLSLHQEEELIPISVKQLIDEKLTGYCRFYTLRSALGICIVAALDNGKTLESFVSVLDDICRECKRILELTVTIGVGQCCPSLAQLERSYHESRDALGYRAMMGEGRVIYIKDVEPGQKSVVQIDSKLASELSTAVRFGSTENIQAVIHKIVENMGHARMHTSQYQLCLIGLTGVLLDIISHYELDAQAIMGGGGDFFEVISSIKNIEELEHWLERVCTGISEGMSAERCSASHRLIQQAQSFIQENYHNPELSLEMLCKQLHVSPAYLSTLFKQETGESYVNYLTGLRLEKAVELLTNTDEKTYIIAAKVGYAEPNYFGYVFKKTYGVSPSKFRSR
ncbi:MAG: response regulator [Angelakisella sp.]